MDSSKRPGNPPCFACLGSAREDKGFPEVLAAIDSLFASAQPINARFALQSSDPDHRSAVALAGFRYAEKECPLVDHPLSEQAYLQLLRDADILLLHIVLRLIKSGPAECFAKPCRRVSP